MQLFNKHKEVIYEALEALSSRNFNTIYSDNPKEYPEEDAESGLTAFQMKLNTDFVELQVNSEEWIGEEVSPYLQSGTGIRYPYQTPDVLIRNAKESWKMWRNVDVEERSGVLMEALERIKERFFELSYATMHTTGQGFTMAFQAAGPHACDRALEAIALGFTELKRYPEQVKWEKWIGGKAIPVQKNYKPIPRGISLIIACSTFPTWNSFPGIFASLITGNPVIVKPHPKAVLPLAITISEIRKVLKESGFRSDTIQLGVDSGMNPLAKTLAEHEDIKLIDYTGNSQFGQYLETLHNKITFTEKASLNPVIIDSTKDIEALVSNIAFSVSLYSRQMCTAPQNIYVPETGIKVKDGYVSFDDFCDRLKNALDDLLDKKWGPATLGCVQNDHTVKRVEGVSMAVGKTISDAKEFKMPDFKTARTRSIKVLAVDSGKQEIFQKEVFGPMVFVIKTESTSKSIELALRGAETFGAITCLVYSNEFLLNKEIEERFNQAFIPVSFNLTGNIFVNQHAAFSDFHGTGGNVSGNASFVDPNFINKRYVWVGNRYMN
ncbi:MAG: aldehyde dehydrogenase family protein [Flavobacteriales bacterium]|nr:aldehyde dehydrogenase family protein [Flavobacteriales bacterium]